MKIKTVCEDYIEFDTGDKITFDHEQDCCERNFADFMSIDDLALLWEFEKPLIFEAIERAGFRFGNPGKMVFVPCYSYQNGYYTEEIDIYFNDELQEFFEAAWAKDIPPLEKKRHDPSESYYALVKKRIVDNYYAELWEE